MQTGKRLEFDKISARICVNNPLFHAYGTAISIMVALNHGSTLVLPAPHFMPDRSLHAIVEEKCNVIYGTPTSESTLFLAI
jgi:acyl-CoA synthetase (AMP-forming)/AMP-acid ligase II